MHKASDASGRQRRATQDKRRLVSAIAIVVFGVVPAHGGPPDQESIDLVEKLQNLEALLLSPQSAIQSNAALIEAVGMSALVRPQDFAAGFVADPPAAEPAPVELSRLNMRLALTPLTQAFGPEDNSLVLNAQTSTDGSALVIRRGNASLADLQSYLQLGLGGTTLTLKTPLVIMSGAALILGPGDVLELSRTDGAFLVNFGHLQIQGAKVVAVGNLNERIGPFQPFVTTADGGTVDVRAGRFVGLGFGETEKFSGLSIMRSVLQTPDRPSRIEHSSFEGLITVSLSGDTGVVLRGNRFHDMLGPSLTVSRTRDARILSNVFYGGMPTNAIRLETGSANGVIAGNVILGGDRAGIVVRTNSVGATVANNIVWNRQGGGIALIESDCGQVHNNLVIENQQKGIEVRASVSARLNNNTIFSNESAGIWISDQPAGAQTMLTGNIVSFNGVGLSGAQTEAILMDGNDFSRQYQEFLSGDIAVQTPEVARHMRGEASFVLASGGVTDVMPEASFCYDQ
jgi:mannuronan 5-epimerase